MVGTAVLGYPRAKTAEETTEKETKPTIEFRAFGDERSFYVHEQFKYFGKEFGCNIPICLRFVSFSEEADFGVFGDITKWDEFASTVTDLKKRGIIKHVTELDDGELTILKQLADYYGVRFGELGGGLGKQWQKAGDFDKAWKTSLEGSLRVIEKLDLSATRAFPFYPGAPGNLVEPGSLEYQKLREQAISIYRDSIVPAFKKRGTAIFLEVEAELHGHDGDSLASFIRDVDSEIVLACHDSANMVRQAKQRPGLALQTFQILLPYLGSLHLKDCILNYAPPKETVSVEDVSWPHRVIGQGAGQYPEIFEILAADNGKEIRNIESRLARAGLKNTKPGFVHEPHLLLQTRVGGFTGKEYDKSIDAGITLADSTGIAYQTIYKPR